MGNARRVVIEFLGEDKSLSTTAAKAENRIGKLGGKMAKVGKIAATGLAAGVAVAGVALFKMGQAAIEDAAGQARLAKAMQNAAGASKSQIAATEDWITAQGKALGVADDDLRPALEKLVVATGDVGKAQKLASLAMDVSAGTGMSLEMVSKSLAKAQNGQVSGLTRLGISTKDAEGKAISFTEAQRRLAKVHKGQAKDSANTLQGKINRLKLTLSEAGETIGAKLIPLVTKMADWFLNKALPAITKFGNGLAMAWEVIKSGEDVAAGLGETLDFALGNTGKYVGPITKMASAIQAVFANLKGGVGGNLEGIKQIFRDAVSIITILWDKFGSNIVQYLKSTFENLKMILSGAFEVIKGIFKTVSALLKGDWSGAWEGIKMILRGAVTVLVGMVRQLFNLVRFAFKNAGVVLKAAMGAIWSGIKSMVASGAAGVVNAVKAIPGKLLGLHKLFASAGKSLLQGFINGMKNAAGIITGIAGNVWNAVKGLLNGAIDKINAALEFTISLPLGKSISINPKNIPHIGGYAKGTNSAARGWAWAGENGPELVNFGGGEQVIPHRKSMAMAGGSSSDQPLLVQFILDGKVVEQSLIKRSRDTGRPIQIRVASA